MSTLELKEILKSKIDNTNDEQFLSEVYAILNSGNQSIINLTLNQKKSIENGQKDYLDGNYFSNDQVNEEMEQWLKE